MGEFLWKRDQAATAVTVSGNGPTFSTERVRSACLDITVKTLTAGTDPTFQVFVDRQGADNIWYQVAETAAFTAVGTKSIDISEAATDGAELQHMIFTNSARVRWVLAGTVAPTLVAFSGSLYGRS